MESGNATGAFLQTPAPVLDKISGPMGARFLSSAGLGSGNLIGRAQFPQRPYWIKIGHPLLYENLFPNCIGHLLPSGNLFVNLDGRNRAIQIENR